MKRLLMIFVFGLLICFASWVAADDSKITLKVSNADIRTVLYIMATKTGLNMVMGPDVSGLVNVRLTNVPPLEALDLLLGSHGFGYVISKGSVLIWAKKSIPTYSKTFVLNHIDAEDARGIVASVVGSDEGEKLSATPRLNSITVKTYPGKLKYVEDLLAEIDHPQLQVLVEARVIEMKSGDGDTDIASMHGGGLKVEGDAKWANIGVLSGPPLASTLGLQAQLLGKNIDVFLTALQRTIGFNYVAAPWVTAVNHQEAEILIGSKLGYKVTTTLQTGTVQDVKFMEVGVKLKFTPHIANDGTVRMVLYPSISDGVVVNEMPQQNTTEVHNEVWVKDGQTIVLGGLKKNYDSTVVTGVPILSQLPLIGGFFGKTETKTEKRDVMILITPHIITPEYMETMRAKAAVLQQR